MTGFSNAEEDYSVDFVGQTVMPFPLAASTAVCGGRIDSTHFYFDQIDMLSQLGLLPTG